MLKRQMSRGSFVLLFGLGIVSWQCKEATVQPRGHQKPGPVDDPACDSLDTWSQSMGLDLASTAPVFVQKAQAVVKSLIPKLIEIQADASSYRNSATWEHVNFVFALNNIPLCQYNARVSVSGDRSVVTGILPTDLPLNAIPTRSQWISSEKDLNKHIDAIMSKLVTGVGVKVETAVTTQTTIGMTTTELSTDVTTATETPSETVHAALGTATETPCLVFDKDAKQLKPGWEVHFTRNNLPYVGLVVGDTVYKAAANYFSEAETEVQTLSYQKAPLASTNLVLERISLNGVSTGGTLCSSRFKIGLGTLDNTNALIATAVNNTFFFAKDDIRFQETEIFTNATAHSNWLLKIGTGVLNTWPTPRINLILDDGNSHNQAVYLPVDQGSPPRILLGNGDGVNLMNIRLDSDAVQHEVGHHIGYQTVKDISNSDTVTLHEAMADYLVIAHKESPCLGVLLCPDGGTICLSTKCLRSADNNMSLTDINLPPEPHKKSQIFSGLLWNVGKIMGIVPSAVLLLKAIDFLPAAAMYPDFIQGLMEADKALYKSAHVCAIQKEALARGLGDQLTQAGVDCKKYL